MKWITVYRHKKFFRKMELAITPYELKKGLLGRHSAGNGLFLMGATAIHTYGMKFPIDVVYLNEKGTVVGLDEKLLPNREGELFQDVHHSVEFNAGTIQQNQIRVGERWYWSMSG